MYKQRDVGMTEKQSVNEGKLLHFTNVPPRGPIIYVHSSKSRAFGLLVEMIFTPPFFSFFLHS